MTDLQNQQNDRTVEAYFDLLRRTADTAMRMFGVEHGLVSVAIVDDERMHELNLRYRGIDRTTDVLSFAAREGEPLPMGKKGEYLGDIAISLPRSRAQAEEYGHGLDRELAFLCAHGMLHLLGYDHMEPEEEREMRQLQNEIMEEMGLSLRKEGTVE